MVQNRRDFIVSAAGSALFFGTSQAAHRYSENVRYLELLALHTNEYLRAPFRVEGDLLIKSLPAIDHLLRDHRTDEVHTIDPDLLDYLYDLGQVLGMSGPFHVISGYRSAATNEQLRRASTGVARRSLHMVGRAVDIRVPGTPTHVVRDAAIFLKQGGVGFYPRSDFVHLDTGRFRHW